MNLTQKQRNELWGENGPYSEIKLSIETRILDDTVSRIFAVVETNINPFTYRMIKKNRKEFKDDEIIQQLLDHVDYRGQEHGYVTCAFRAQLIDGDQDIMDKAQECVEYTKETLIKMHKYVMKMINKPAFVIRVD